MTNQEKAGRAIDVLAASYNMLDQDEEADILELLMDLRHLCDFEGFDFDELVSISGDRYNK